MSTDTQLDEGRALALVRDWHIHCAHERTTLARVTAELSADSLADEDIREHLQARLRQLERDQARWLALATWAFERRVQRAVWLETARPT